MNEVQEVDDERDAEFSDISRTLSSLTVFEEKTCLKQRNANGGVCVDVCTATSPLSSSSSSSSSMSMSMSISMSHLSEVLAERLKCDKIYF